MSTEERRTQGEPAAEAAGAAGAAGLGAEGAAGAEEGAGGAGADERMRILRLVAEGKLSPSEAAELLAALEPGPGQTEQPAGAGGGEFPFGSRNTFRYEGTFGPGGPFGPRGPFGPGGPFGVAAGEGGPKVVATVRGGSTPPMPPRPPRPPGQAGRTLIIHSQREESEVNARIPIGLLSDAERFLPRQAKEHLGECEVDVKALLESLASIDLDAVPKGFELVKIQEGETEVVIKIE